MTANYEGPSEEELDIVTEALLGTWPTPSPTPHWSAHPTVPGRQIASEDTHKYSVTPDGDQVLLRIYATGENEPIAERRYASPANAKSAATRHYKKQLARAEHFAKTLADLPEPLFELVARLIWSAHDAEDDPRAADLCQRLGVKDFDDPICRSEFTHHVLYVDAKLEREIGS